MSRALKERIKNLIILILIVAGILQGGILLGYQSQWTPSSIWGLFNRPRQISISDEEARDRLFTPNRLILSDGEKLCVIDKANEIYVNLWKEAHKDLSSMASGALDLKASSKTWDDLIVKNGIIIDFGYPMKPELLKWFLGVGKISMDIPDIFKILISPDIVEPNTGVIYISDSNGKVYESDTVIFEPDLNLEEAYASVSEKQKYRFYNTLRGANIDKTLDASGDILFVNSPPRYWPYYEYSCRIPAKAEKRDEFAKIVLGNEKDRYNIPINSDMIQYEYGNNIYRFYSDGCLTYQNAGDSSVKEDMGSALLNAYKFVNRINQLSDSAADIVLTDIVEKQQGVYDISFDYYLNGMPVKLGPDVQVGSGDKFMHAVNIQADSKKVLKCEWLLRDFVQFGKNSYNDRILEVMSLAGHEFDKKKIKINNVLTGYFIKSTSDQKLAPKMLIEFEDKTMFQVEMPVEKGD